MPTAWKQLFVAMLSETDSARLPRRIEEARAAIMQRVEELLNDEERQPEHDEILNALNRLAELESGLSLICM